MQALTTMPSTGIYFQTQLHMATCVSSSLKVHSFASCWASGNAAVNMLAIAHLFRSALMSYQGLLNFEMPLPTDKEAYDTDLHSRVPLACHSPSGPLP